MQNDEQRLERAGPALATRIGRTRVRIAVAVVVAGMVSSVAAAFVLRALQLEVFDGWFPWMTIGVSAMVFVGALYRAEEMGRRVVAEFIPRWRRQIAREFAIDPIDLEPWSSPRRAAPRRR